jgi:AhpD family alkylhydroperoxidase
MAAHGSITKTPAPMIPEPGPYKAAPEAMKAKITMRESGLEHWLVDLHKTRASQTNICAYCIDKHSSVARARRDRGAPRFARCIA